MAFEITQLPRDDESIRKYVERYKALRLLSLQTAPEFFGSTYEREVAFTDETWHGRLSNPLAVTFTAVQGDQFIGTMTIIGPLPFSPEESPALDSPWNLDGAEPSNPGQSHWRFNGTFTVPEARKQGVAKAIMEKSIEFASQDAAKSGKEFAGSIVVDSNNTAATALYRKCGFVNIREEPRSPSSTRTVFLMKYLPNCPEVKTMF